MPGATIPWSHYKMLPCNRVKHMGTNKRSELKASFCEIPFIVRKVSTQELKVTFLYYPSAFPQIRYVPTVHAPEQASAAVAL
jgi:hypothetical protein